MPETIRALVQIAHCEIAQYGSSILRAPPPDRRVREQAVVAPRIATIELFPAHVLRLEHHVRRVVFVPITMHDPALRFELPEERRSRIRGQDMKRGAFEPVGLDPLDRALEHIRPI